MHRIIGINVLKRPGTLKNKKSYLTDHLIKNADEADFSLTQVK